MLVRYYRKIDSGFASWSKDKKQKKAADENVEKFLMELTKGIGSPSIWKVENPEDLERICLGLTLSRSHPNQSMRFIGFDEECFANSSVSLIQDRDADFPVSDVEDLHYVLNCNNQELLTTLVDTFMLCKGELKEFKFMDGNQCGEKCILDMVVEYEGCVKKNLVGKLNEIKTRYGR